MKTNEFKNVYQVAELGIKYNRFIETEMVTAGSPSDCSKFLRNLFTEDEINYRECFWALYLSRSNKIIACFEVSRGGITGTVVDPSMIFAQGVLCGAKGIILSHNHPSGNLKPSDSDLKLTQKIKQGALLLDMTLLDHIIITDKSYMSFGDEGLL